MSSNPPYPPSSNPNDPTSQQYPPRSAPTFNYGFAYPPPSNQGAYLPPVETVPANNPAFPPPPSYESTFGKPAGQPNPYGQNNSFMPAAALPSYPPPPASSDVEYQGSSSAYHDRIISFNDKTIRLGAAKVRAAAISIPGFADQEQENRNARTTRATAYLLNASILCVDLEFAANSIRL
ncbi:actin nucleation-promoting factor WASL-like [Montipora foliosa]|uniref:actin nucleation-promoting factor WASL-like n=1 Tax=Montipora foliosa TaxID=591990 RepID=UPI0035F1075C